MKAKFATSGQDCLGANRFYVQRPVYDEFCRRFAGKAAALTVGRGIDDPDIGPLLNAKAVAKQQERVADALAQGSRLRCGGEHHRLGPLFFPRRKEAYRDSAGEYAEVQVVARTLTK